MLDCFRGVGVWVVKKILFVLALVMFSSPALADKYAFILGNAAYEELSDLRNTHADAEAYAQAFRDLDYQVTLLLDRDLDEMIDGFDAFLSQIQPGDEVAFVYSGHGWSDGSRNYMAPTDAPVQGSDNKLSRASYVLQDGRSGILDQLRSAGAGMVVAIIDACRDNPFEQKPGTKSASFERGLARIQADAGTYVVFSAGTGQTALDRLPTDPPDQKLSVFTRHLAPLLKPGVNLRQAVQQARSKTAKDAASFSGHQQSPAIYDQVIRNEICLGGACQPIPSAVQAPLRCDALYSAAAEAKACFAYEAYFENCRDHSLAPIADGYLKQFCQVKVVAKVDEEPTKTCSQDAKLCDDDKVCSIAVLNGRWDTSSIKQSHVQEAKKRGLDCGVEIAAKVVKKTCSISSPKICMDIHLCSLATYGSERKFWQESYPTAIAEAKKRGLDCGVEIAAKVVKKTCSISSPKICMDIHLCSLATYGSERKFWQESYPTAIAEAKKRGLTCGASEIRSKKVFDKKDKTAVKYLQIKLNSIGCASGYPDGVWGRQTQAAVNLFAKTAGLPAVDSNVISQKYLNALTIAKQGFCPKLKPLKINTNLTGRWAFEVSCGNRTVKGRAQFTLANNNEKKKRYDVSYTNELKEKRQAILNLENGFFDINFSYVNGRLNLVFGGRVSKNMRTLQSNENNSGCVFQARRY